MSKDDFSRRSIAKPRTIELIGDGKSGLFVYGQTVGDEKASCNETCRRLLFNGEADWVRMTRIPDLYMNKRSGSIKNVTYHIEHRESCPQLYPDGTEIEKAVRDRLIAGECVIAEGGGDAGPDATLKFVTRYSNHQYPPKPPDDGPALAIIETVKNLRIENRQDAELMEVVQRTETIAQTVVIPFYIGADLRLQGGYNGPVIGRRKTALEPIDLAQILRSTFGYEVGEISAPPPEDVGKVGERILALPLETTPVLSAQQQDALNDQLALIATQPTLSDADVDFVRRVIADRRVTEAKLGVVLQRMFGKHAERLKPLIPVVLDRISTPVPERIGHYQSMLGWSLANFSAESLRPYRDKMIAVVENQADWPSSGVLTRLAEVGGDKAINLVIQRLDSKSMRQYAAIATCRAGAETWAALEPAILAHLTPPQQRDSLQDDEHPLLLGLVRFGKKSLVADMIEKRGLFDKTRTLERLAKYEQGFDPKHCQDHL